MKCQIFRKWHPSVLSPIYFNVIINDLPESFQSSSALFAHGPCFWEVGNIIEEQENGIFNAHIKSVRVKCLKRLNVLEYLKCSNWGVSKDRLLPFYRASIRSIINYGMEVYFNSADCSLK